MNDKKHIDRLFQEGLKDFEATPKDAVWKNIEAELKSKNKKRRVIPVWWRYAGAAAILLLLLTTGYTIFNNQDYNNNINNQVVDTETNLPENILIKDLETSGSDQFVTNNSDDGNSNAEKTSDNTSKIQNQNSSLTSSEDVTIAKSETASSNSSDNKTLKKSNYPLAPKNAQNQTAAIIANNNTSSNTPRNNEENPLLVKPRKAKKLIIDTYENPSSVAKTKEDSNTNEITNEITIEEAIAATQIAASSDDIVNVKKKNNRWALAPNIAPVYFNSLGSGSSIDMQFSNSPKSGELNMSYGINASYAVNNKIKIRSGINRVNLGYNTENVIAFQSVGTLAGTGTIPSIKTSNINPQGDMSFISKENLAANNTIALNTVNTSINQSIGYIEVPLEIEYALVNKKLGVNIIGGFSSLFLNSNRIYSEPQGGSRTLLGEANNINNLSYSANLGVGFNYQVSKKIDFNFEPIFKYQLNTFNKTYGDFTPYFIGVYTGFAIKF
ncbi:porin family protein [Gaetbulibacter saemankumensis]|uniref:hypothetical protein n=1 Tax=Gaetbulibacter saemankumensis TaxID=311208 RepID=UPI00040B4232|nr:hypothetical protein [Gaetbulibacter saemankumensis]